MFRRLVREVIIGATTTGATGRQEDPAHEVHSKTAIVVQRHQFQESIELLNAMRRVGGVRRIGRGVNDNGAPVGQISERVMRHVDFNGLNNHIQNGTDYDSNDSQWGEYGSAVTQEHPMQRTESFDAATKLRSIQEVHRPKNVRTLQDELLGNR